MRKNAILNYQMEYELYVAIEIFQRYFTIVFYYFDVKSCELLIFIQICAELHSIFGFGHPFIVLAVKVSQ